MNNEKRLVLETIETVLEIQLRSVRTLLRRGRSPSSKLKKRASKISMIENVLRSAGGPLHISEVIAQVKSQFDVDLDRESTTSALSKKIAKKDTFLRTGKNTFTLIAQDSP